MPSLQMDLIRKYFPELNPLQMQQLMQFREQILKWNRRLNLISRKDTDHIEERHILHSLGIAAFYTFPDSSRVLDVGTGGGFPGIPLAILHPRAHFTLVDSIGKKISAVREICAALELSNVGTRQVRAEHMEGRFQFIVSRAVTRLDRFTGWVGGHLTPSTEDCPQPGILYLKGGDLEEELRPFPAARIHPLGDRFSEPFFETKNLVFLPSEGLV